LKTLLAQSGISIAPCRNVIRATGQRATVAMPSSAPKSPVGPGWIHEIKHDGFRLMARRESAGVWMAAALNEEAAKRKRPSPSGLPSIAP
jgi:hypothetical protein